MRSRPRYLLAVMLVATAMFADRATAAESRADLVPPRGIVDRLADGFRRTIATRPVVRQRCPWSLAATVRSSSIPNTAVAIVPPPTCPACLPQPPPC